MNNEIDIMKMVCREALRSPDPSTQNAAILCDEVRFNDYTCLSPQIGTSAVNEFPHGVKGYFERWQRPQKYGWVEHAERNSIYRAAAHGISTYFMVMVCPWAACADCARAIVQSGISRLVTMTQTPADTNDRWNESINQAMVILKEGGVQVDYLDGPLGLDFTILRDGKPYAP